MLVLEVVEIVQIEEHGRDKDEKVEADPEVRVRPLIILEHNE